MKQQPPCKRKHLEKVIKNFPFIGYTETLTNIFWILYNALGSQYWWPGDSPFEITVGAILTQNTSWNNVEKAINNLKSKKLLDPFKLLAIDQTDLATLIKPAGYYNIKAARLKNFLGFLIDKYNGDLDLMALEDTDSLRNKLLQIKGIGPETADSILLYALNKPSFVIDAYTIRILSRHNIIDSDVDYHQVRELFMTNLPNDPCLFNEYHALFVNIGKNHCKKRKPLCVKCPLKDF